MKSDFSVFALFTAGLSCLAQVSAQTTPVGEPLGNPIFNPGLNDIVPAGEPYSITWDPTTQGTVTIVLLRGPSENVKPLYPIAEKVENSGLYVWTPSTDLEPDTKRYGIQLIVDGTGQYQYSTQFGISNPDYKPSASSSVATITSTLSHAPSSSASMSAEVTAGHANSTAYTTQVVTAYTTYCPAPTSVVMNNKTYTVTAPTTLTISDCPCTISMPVTSAAVTSSKPTHAMSSSYHMGNTTMVAPTGGMTVPASLRTSTRGSPTGSASPIVSVPAEGAAGKMAVGVGAVAAAVLAAFAL